MISNMEILHEEGRFRAKTAHGDAELLYKIEGKVMLMYHTFVPADERGNGIAERLALAAFAYAKDNGLKVRPACSYIRHFVETHKEMQGYVG